MHSGTTTFVTTTTSATPSFTTILPEASSYDDTPSIDRCTISTASDGQDFVDRKQHSNLDYSDLVVGISLCSHAG